MAISPITPELQSKIALWRQKSLDGTLTLDEMRQAVIEMRGGRGFAQEASAASKKSSSKKPARAADDMLSELEGL